MKKEEKFNNILNECLDRILRGETVEECLRNYPQEAAELEPLLRTAVSARIASTIQPSPQFKARARSAFQTALQEMEERRSRKSWISGWHWRWQSAWSMAVVAALVIVIGGGSTVAASSGSMPDSVLYPVKIAREKVQMALTFSEVGKAELNARLADERVDEIIYMAYKGDSQQVQAVAQRLNSNLTNIVNLVGAESAQPVLAAQDTATSEAASKSRNSQQPMLAAGVTPPATVPADTPVTLAAAPSDAGLYPPSGATGISVKPTFTWPEEIPGCSHVPLLLTPGSYDFEIADNPVFANPIESQTGLTTNSWNLTVTLEPGRTYFWRVRNSTGEDNQLHEWVQFAFTTAPETQTAPAPGNVDTPAVFGTGSSAPPKYFDPESGLYFDTEEEREIYRAAHPESGLGKDTARLEELKQLLINYALTHPARLEEALSQVPEEARPALREAITKALTEYSKLMSNIENLRNLK